MLTVAFEDPYAVVDLLEAGEAFAAALYPAESNHFLDLDALRGPDVHVAVARLDGQAVGTGAVVLNGDGAEIKRMWLEPEARGTGAAQAIYDVLEAQVRRQGIALLRLETGIHNHAALKFYERQGFQFIPPFEPYADDPNSVFMEKRLA